MKTQNFTLDTAVDVQVTVARYLPANIGGLCLRIPTLNASAKVSIQGYFGKSIPTTDMGNAALLPSANTDWVDITNIVLNTDVTPGNIAIALDDGIYALGGMWIRFVCSVDQTPGVGEPATLVFVANIV